MRATSGRGVRDLRTAKRWAARQAVFAEAYPERCIVQQAVGQIPWGHNVVLLDKVKATERLWYAAQAVEHGWSRNVLVHQIESGLYARKGHAITNFERTLPTPQSDLARDLLKDPYQARTLSRSAALHDEGAHMFDAFLGDAEVVEAIANGETRRTWISSTVGRSGAALQNPLSWLLDMGVVSQEAPGKHREC